jgi:DNA-binding MarR family transcriptional regulator
MLDRMAETPPTRLPTAAAALAVPGDALDTDLGWTLGVVFRAYVKAVDALMGDLPGGPRGYQVLTAAVQGPPGGQGALAQLLGIDKTVMTYLVDDLERAGLVLRRANPADRRTKQIVATGSGRGAWQAIQARVEHVEEHVLAPLPARDRAVFRESLRLLAAHAQTLDPAGDTCRIINDLAADDPAFTRPALHGERGTDRKSG